MLCSAIDRLLTTSSGLVAINIKCEKLISLQHRVRAMKSHIQKSTNHFFWDNVIARSHIALTIHLKLYTKFEVSSSSSFEDIFNRIPKILGVT